jgi:ABC-2 type transport system permease protein
LSGQLSAAWALARKDWQLFLSDRRAAFLCFAVPIVLASVFGVVFHRPGSGMSGVRLPLLLVVEDDSDFTRRVADDLVTCSQLDVTVLERQSARERVEGRGCGVALVLPAGFGRLTSWPMIRAGDRPAVEVFHHPLSAVEAQWAEGVLTEVVMHRLVEKSFATLGRAAVEAAERPFVLRKDAVPGEHRSPFNSYSHSFCGMTLQYLLFWGMESGLALLRERQRGLWRRFQAAPVTVPTLLLGKAIATAGVALAMVLVTFGFGWLAFGVTVTGSWLAFAALTAAVALLSAATGLLVAAAGGTEGRARSVCILVILGVSLLGGLWLPMFLLPGWAQPVAWCLPTAWAMRGLDGVTWQGMTFAEALPCLGAVLGFGLGFLAAAAVWFAWSESRARHGGGL